MLIVLAVYSAPPLRPGTAARISDLEKEERTQLVSFRQRAASSAHAGGDAFALPGQPGLARLSNQSILAIFPPRLALYLRN